MIQSDSENTINAVLIDISKVTVFSSIQLVSISGPLPTTSIRALGAVTINGIPMFSQTTPLTPNDI